MLIDRNFGTNRELIQRAINFSLLMNMMKLNKEIKVLNVTEQNKKSVVQLSINGERFDYSEQQLPLLSKVIKEQGKEK